MDIVIYTDLKTGCGKYEEYICTSDRTCLPDFDDRYKAKRYAIVYLESTDKGYCIHCIEQFLKDLQYIEKIGVQEAKIQIGKLRSGRTVEAAKVFLFSILRGHNIRHKQGSIW